MPAKVDPFAAFLTARQTAKVAASAKVAVSLVEWEGRKVFHFEPPDAKPFNLGGVKVSLIMGLTDAAVAALDALPPALLDVTGARARFVRAHRAEIAALLPQVN